MSVAQTAERISKQAGNGATVAFSGSWKIFAATELKVYKINAAGAYSALLTNGVDYTVVFDTDAETWTVTYTVAPVSSGFAVIIGSGTPDTQATSFPREGVVPASTIKNAFDKLTVLVQQLRDRLDRSPAQAETPVNPNNPIVIGTVTHRRAMIYQVSGSDVTIVPSTYDPDTQQAASAASAAAAAASAAAAATSAALFVTTSGTSAARPAAPAANQLYYATDTGELAYFNTVSGRWHPWP